MPFRKLLTLFALIQFLVNTNYSQNKTLDSLNSALLKNPKKDSSYIKTLNTILDYCVNNDVPNKSAQILNTYSNSIALSNKVNYNNGVSQAHLLLGTYYEFNKKQDSALLFYFKGLNIYEKNNQIENLKMIHRRISRLFFYMGNLNEANHHVDLLISLLKNHKNEKQLGTAYMMKAVFIQNMPDSIPFADKYYKSAISIFEVVEPNQLPYMYNNYGEYLSDKMNSQQESLDFFEKSKKIALSTGDTASIAYADFCIGKVYLKIKNYPESKLYLLKAADYWIRKNKTEDQLYVYEKLADLTYASGDYKTCIYYIKTEKKLRDSLNKLTNVQNLNELETKYEVEKKDKELSYLREKSILEALEAEKQNNRNTILWLGVGVLLLFGIFTWFALINKQKVNKLLDAEKNLVLSQKNVLQTKNKEILDSITYAKRIQTSLMASKELLDQNLKEYFIFFKPKDLVSGDFYRANVLPNGNFAMITADSTGHGVPGAIMSLLNITFLRESVKEGAVEPSNILNRTRDLIIDTLKKDGSAEGGKDGMDCSLISFNFKQNKIAYACANNPIWVVRNNQVIELAADKMPVGKHEKQEIPFKQSEFNINKGDVIYTFTDGFADQFGGANGKKYMSKRLRELLIKINNLSMDEQRLILDQTFIEWIGNLEQVDDVTIIGVRV